MLDEQALRKAITDFIEADAYDTIYRVYDMPNEPLDTTSLKNSVDEAIEQLTAIKTMLA